VDLLIKNGLLVSAGGRSNADIGILEGKIARISDSIPEQGCSRVLDATDCIVTPGGVDPHVHLTPPTREEGGWKWVDDFDSGTETALAGGVTSVGNISFPERGESIRTAIDVDGAEASKLARADFFLHPVLLEPNDENLREIPALHAEGHTSIKFFLSFRRFDRQVDSYLKAMRSVGSSGGIALIHCEDAAIMECCCNLLRESGDLSAEHYPHSRPVHAEAVATRRAIAFSETTDCPVYIVHLASGEALRACTEGRARSIKTFVETRPLYLHLTEEKYKEEGGARYAGAPPLRSKEDVFRLWAGLSFGDVDTIATDHAPWMLADKLDSKRDATTLLPGVAELETNMPMLFSSGVLEGKITLEKFVALTSTNAAKLFGLYPRKGSLSIGADADLVVWDPNEVRSIDSMKTKTRCDYSPYEGWSVKGWPRYTVSRGELVAQGSEVIGEPGRGELILRGPHQSL